MKFKVPVTFLTEFESDQWKSIRRFSTELYQAVNNYDSRFEFHFFRPPNHWQKPFKVIGRRFLYPMHIARMPRGLLHVVDQSYANLLAAAPANLSILTCHDLQFWRARSALNSPMRRHLLRCVLKARVIACPSSTVQSELAELLPEVRGRLRVIANAIGSQFFNPEVEQRRELRKKFGITNQAVLLHVGNVALPRKNIEFLFKVLNNLRKAGQADWRLVQIGSCFSDQQKLEIRSLGLEKYIHQIVDATETELVEWYQSADFCLMPSLYEGFGYPLIEAAACGRPVICSDIEVFREVTAGLALTLPLDVLRWRLEIEKIQSNGILYQKHAEMSLELAKKYTVQVMAHNYLRIYEDIAKEQNWL